LSNLFVGKLKYVCHLLGATAFLWYNSAVVISHFNLVRSLSDSRSGSWLEVPAAESKVTLTIYGHCTGEKLKSNSAQKSSFRGCA